MKIRNKNSFSLAIFFSLLSAATSFAASKTQVYISESGQKQKVLPQVLVKYKTGSSAFARQKMSKYGAVKTKSLGKTEVNLIDVPKGYSVQTFINEIKNDPDIEFVEPNGIVRKFDTPNDPAFSGDQYSLKSGYTKVQQAWDITVSTDDPTRIFEIPGATVAVIDTGVEYTNDDLENQMWNNPGPLTATSGTFGMAVEINWDGGDCLGSDDDLGQEQCEGDDPMDDNSGEYHGTRVAGIIGAETNNNNAIAGIARNSRIMAIKALNPLGNGSFSGIATAIDYAVDNGASVINLSLGGASTSQSVAAAIARAIANNVVVVAASGNDGVGVPVNFPANIASVIAVGATNGSNSLASFSCTGAALDLVAPGVDIVSTVATNTFTSLGDFGNNGTSFSAPMVSGVAALIRGIFPTMSVEKVTEYITLTATDLGAGGTDNYYGHGLLNAKLAIESALGGRSLVSTSAPGETHLYPNPFNPLNGGTAAFAIPPGADESGVEIKILNVAGELVKTIHGVDYKTWNGKNEDGSFLAPGIYFYRARTSVGDLKGKLTIQQ